MIAPNTGFITAPGPAGNAPNPLDSLAKAAQYQNLLLAGQQHQQQLLNEQEALKTHQLANVETQRAQKEAEDFQQAHMDALGNGGTVKDAIDLAEKRGVRVPYLNKVKDEWAKQVEQAAKTSAEQLKASQAQTSLVYQDAASMDQIKDPTLQQQAWDANNQKWAKLGLPASPYPGPDGVHQLVVKSATLNDLHSAAKVKQEADEAARKEQLFPSQLTKSQGEAVTAEQKATGQEPIQPQQAAQLARETARDAALRANEESSRKIAQQNANTNAGRLRLEIDRNNMENGPNAVNGWVETLKMNPDAVKEVAPRLRTAVSQAFTKATGLPLPTPLQGQLVGQENAARNTLDNAEWLAEAAQNPLISGQTGALLGRLGNAEMRLGTAVGLSPEAERLGQEFRNRAKQFVFQDAKAVSGGGRMSPQVLKELEDVSASPKMDPNMFQGALNGAIGNAQTILRNTDRARFGNKSRSDEALGIKPIKQPGPKSDLSGKSTDELLRMLK